LTRIKLISLFIAVLCINININLYAQNKNKTNQEIFDNIISSGLEKYYFYPGIDRNYTFVFIVNTDESGGNSKYKADISRFLSSVIKKTAGNNNIKFSIAPDEKSAAADTNINLVFLRVQKMQTQYPGFKKNKFLGSKTLERNFKVDIGVTIINGSNTKLNERILSDYGDVIDYDNYEQLQESPYDFTKADAPEISSFETIIFPVLLITVSAAATILFFTIRSK
jgi:hypothetical protein